MTEDVLHQQHYVRLPIQPIMVMLKDLTPAEFMGFLKGNALKYILRADGKNGLEDYAKAKQYATWMEEFARTGTIRIPGATERSDKAREVHHYYTDSGSDETADAKFVVDLMEELFPELRREGAER